MRRTASLDAIYLKGPWPKEDQPFTPFLNIDKASQTPEEWVSTCYGGLNLGWSSTTYEEAYQSGSNSSSNNSSNSNSRRPSVSVTPSPLLSISHQVPPASGEQIDKFIRQRLRTNKEGTGSGRLRYSPLPGDPFVLTPSPVHPRHQALQQTNGGSRAIPIPPLPKPLLPPRLRSSVEGLNQEIERLVLRPTQMAGDDLDDWGEVARDGRRAPIAEYLRFTRSIDTQTPAQGSTVSATSSNHTSPSSISPPTSPPQTHDPVRPPSTPSPTSAHALATSPHINKFLARAPPDGCERVALKLHDIHRPEATKTGDWPAVRPPGGFTLRPSQGSAFCPLERISAEQVCETTTALHVCEHDIDPVSETCTLCASDPSSCPEGSEEEHIQACQAASQTCDVGVSTLGPGPASTSLATPSELTADQ
ncbi:hypothetical protein Pmani_038312 [Petrolisthes manimaculis]|uniref:Uncharacterized protein n=1 Tax=Petrolisthes manimaculis TaxID=1843537 RepID=A0AAE1NEP8_9EUCA|nr:hypothetical protein Pmani_038312 [Petrolisthes manimaculis]